MVPAKNRSRFESAACSRRISSSDALAWRADTSLASSARWKRPRSSDAAFRVKVTAAMRSIWYAPSATPAAMRSASICVLPDPAPASTRIFVSSSSRIRRRDSRSIVRESDMSGEPRVRVQPGILQFSQGLVVDGPTAGGGVVAEPAVVGIGCADEAALHNQLAKIAEHAGDRRLLRSGDGHALLPPLVAGKVVHASDHLGILVFTAKQCDRSQAVERVLKAAAAVERPLPAVAPESAGLV